MPRIGPHSAPEPCASGILVPGARSQDPAELRLPLSQLAPHTPPPIRRLSDDKRPGVLVLGVYLASKPNHMRHIVGNLSSTKAYRVVQHWIALGGIAPDYQLQSVTRGFQPALVPKFPLINQLLENEQLPLYEYVVIVDDDIRLPNSFLDLFLRAQSALDFCLAQPARTPSSHIDHPIVTQQAGGFARQTLWVEVGPLVSIHRSIFNFMFPFDPRSPMGWGYENVWAYELSRRGLKMGIIDKFPIDHSLRLPHCYYSGTEAHSDCRRLLADRPHLPLEECQQVLADIVRDPLQLIATERTESSPPTEWLSSDAPLDALIGETSDQGCSVLDWESGYELTSLRSDHVIFSPVLWRDRLPYFDKSIDIVVLPSRDPRALSEARRVARLGVIEVGAPGKLRFCRLAPQPHLSCPTISIIIPTYNHAELIDQCLSALLPTLPECKGVEVLIVDDGSSDDTRARVASWAARDHRVRLHAGSGANEGFVKACNRGALAAQGGLLILLNNDTVPLKGWLQALLRTFATHPEAGVVGGKLIYPDGCLQEAGSVVFVDGSAANVGNGAQIPHLPLYNYLREVDYCSGALLATPRSLFLKLGALDEKYSPAYYEDVDYCFKVRATGHRVYYQPRSVVVHVGGATAGKDCGSGIKRYQDLNRTIFERTWKEVLDRHPSRPASFDPGTWRNLIAHAYGSRAAKRERRALVCAPSLPEFDRESGSRRIFDHIESLRLAGWKVVFAAQQGDCRSRYVNVLEERGVETYCSFDQIDELLSCGDFDLALLAFWQVAETLLPRTRRLASRARVVVDSIDLHFLRNARRRVRSWNYRAPVEIDADHTQQMRRELAVYEAADAVFTVSQTEAAILSDLLASRVLPLVAPDGDEIEISQVPWSERKGLLFLGNFRHPPNAEALSYLCQEVLPRVPDHVRATHPVYIVGNDLAKEAAASIAHLPNVISIGWVPSIEPYLHHSRMLVAPLLHGAGTKRKMIQSLLAGTPVVATSVASEGLPIRAEQHFLRADDASSFAIGITRLAGDDILCQDLTVRGRRAVESHYSRQAARTMLFTAIDSVLTRPLR